MKNKRIKTAHIATVAAFAAFILGFFGLLMLLHKHEGELSKLEFRSLAVNPFKGASFEELSRGLVRGELSDEVDTYLEDHFPGRSFFIAVNSYVSRLAGRNAVQSVVRGRNGRLFDAPLEVDNDVIDSNVNRIEAFADGLGIRPEIVIVPSAAVCVEADLPFVRPVYHDAEVVSYVSEHSSAKVYDLPELYVNCGEDVGSLFYRTDHHWTMDGAYVCYRELCREAGVRPVGRAGFEIERYDFYGSFYRKAGLWLTEPDELQIWRSPMLDAAKVTIGFGDNARVYTGVYDGEMLKEGEIDRYAAYLYSNNGLTVIETDNGNDDAIMIIKDSFGNSIAPLFCCDYGTVIMVDTRYYSTNLPDPSEIARQYGVSRILVVFGTESMVTESWLGYLR